MGRRHRPRADHARRQARQAPRPARAARRQRRQARRTRPAWVPVGPGEGRPGLSPAARAGCELAEKIFTDAAPLAARVIVNRVWGWHFGKPLVDTPSDFGTQGEKPSHPQLLDDLAARFIANGWSLKWLHREIMLSAAYQQASRPRPDAAKIDPANRLLWRMNPRRLDIEAYRDCILQATRQPRRQAGRAFDGPRASRQQTPHRLRPHQSRPRSTAFCSSTAFPKPTMHSPGRETTTTPLQQLFVMNSPFMRDQAAALVGKRRQRAGCQRQGSCPVPQGAGARSQRARARPRRRVSCHRHDDGLCPRIALHQ